MYDYLTPAALEQFISQALAEDNGKGAVNFFGDHSALSAVPETAQNTAQLLIKGDGILAGLDLARLIFEQVDRDLNLTFFKKDGEQVQKGEIAFEVSGRVQSILTAERVVLNCMQRMSGIATLTQKYVQAVSHTRAKILDTRKTTPNSRLIEKWAVRIGGGTNHRFGLFDMIMLKDNHVDFAGGIRAAITAAHRYLEKHQQKLPIEIETRNLDEVEEVLKVGGVDVIMLDNMSIDAMKAAVALIGGRFETEASGGITLETIAAVAETGVDSISVGALTHSYQSIDLSLKAKK
jgi:nicotinate-nucleotide pyrophosphorylase (carboxylating)